MSLGGIKHDVLNLEALRQRAIGGLGNGEEALGKDPAQIKQLQSLLGLPPTGQLDPETENAIKQLLGLFNLDQPDVNGSQGGGSAAGPAGSGGAGSAGGASGAGGDIGLLIELAKQALNKNGQPAGGNSAPSVGAKSPAGSMLGRAFSGTNPNGLFRSGPSVGSKDSPSRNGTASSPVGSPTRTSSLQGNTNAERAFNYFVDKGLTREQAAGIVGNLQQESGVNPGQHQIGGPAFGIAQWEGSRQSDLRRFAAQRGTPVDDLGTQLDFMWHEMQTTERGSLDALRGARTASEAAQIFERRYERAGIPNMQARVSHAEDALRTFG